ncbi:DUF6308 family protein [Pseudarthrobacter sp. MDT1-22]
MKHPRLEGSLRDTSPTIREAIADLFDALEEKRANNVKLTTLSKVLHRKRPELLALFDAKISYCYTDYAGAPVPKERKRSKRDYRLRWREEVQNDLDSQHDQWEEIAAIAPGPKITPLRALDIIGWELGRRRS